MATMANKCHNCGAIVPPTDDPCQNCGALAGDSEDEYQCAQCGGSYLEEELKEHDGDNWCVDCIAKEEEG